MPSSWSCSCCCCCCCFHCRRRWCSSSAAEASSSPATARRLLRGVSVLVSATTAPELFDWHRINCGTLFLSLFVCVSPIRCLPTILPYHIQRVRSTGCQWQWEINSWTLNSRLSVGGGQSVIAPNLNSTTAAADMMMMVSPR